MTFQELQNKIGPQTESEWSKHKNGGGWVKNTAKVDDTAFVGENAIVYDTALVCGSARVYGSAQVYDTALVCGGEWKKSPLYIQGSKYPLTNTKPNHVQIGCKCATFSWWQSSEGEKFARDNGFTDAEIEEYRAYLELFVKIGK